MPHLFEITGYWKDDKTDLNGLVYEFDECPDHLKDEDIFFYGLSEENIKELIEAGENSAYDFVITSYTKKS